MRREVDIVLWCNNCWKVVIAHGTVRIVLWRRQRRVITSQSLCNSCENVRIWTMMTQLKVLNQAA